MRYKFKAKSDIDLEVLSNKMYYFEVSSYKVIPVSDGLEIVFDSVTPLASITHTLFYLEQDGIKNADLVYQTVQLEDNYTGIRDSHISPKILTNFSEVNEHVKYRNQCREEEKERTKNFGN